MREPSHVPTSALDLSFARRYKRNGTRSDNGWSEQVAAGLPSQSYCTGSTSRGNHSNEVTSTRMWMISKVDRDTYIHIKWWHSSKLTSFNFMKDRSVYKPSENDCLHRCFQHLHAYAYLLIHVISISIRKSDLR